MEDKINITIIEAIKTIASVPGYQISYDVDQVVDKAPFKKGATKKIYISITLTKEV